MSTIKALCLGIMVSAVALFAIPVTTEDISRIQSFTAIQHVLYETYLDTDDGLAGVIGFHYDAFFHPNFYIGTAIFGAVTGDRGGYGIAAVGPGYRHQLSPRLFIDSKALIGSGGGGGLAAGGGFAWEVQTGLSIKLNEVLFFDTKYGYLSFPTGTFSTPVVSFGFSIKTQPLFLPY